MAMMQSSGALFALGLFAALWLLAGLWAVGRGIAMQRRSAFVAGQTERLASLVEASPQLPVIVRADWRIEASERLGRWLGLDASATMLGHARSRPGAGNVTWVQGDAAALPCRDASCDGVLCTLAIHHFSALGPAFTEIARVLRRDAPFVCFTSLAGQMRHYWLWRYFPRMMAASTAQMPQRPALEAALRAAGLTQVRIEPFTVTPALQDLFLYSGKQRPQLYLDAGVRANISSFARLCPKDELEQGLAALRADLAAGRFDSDAGPSAGEAGDYAFVIARVAA